MNNLWCDLTVTVITDFDARYFVGSKFPREGGGRDIAMRTDHTVTETLIRSMYDYWRRVMDV